jgi:hypothetical protein
VQLERQAEAEAELSAMTTTMNEKVTSYQSTVAQRATEATSYKSWSTSHSEYVEALDGVIDLVNTRIGEIGNQSNSMAEVHGVIQGMKLAAESKSQEADTTHTAQDADFLTLVNSYRQSLSDTQAAYSTKRSQMETAAVTARDAGDERDVRQLINTGEESLLDVMMGLCTADSGKIPLSITEGDTLLESLQTRVSAAVTDMTSMPDVTSLIQQGPAKTPRSTSSHAPSHGSPMEELKRMAVQVKARKSQNIRRPQFVGHHVLASRRKAITVKVKKPAVRSIVLHSNGSLNASQNASIVHAIGAPLAHVATSAVAVKKQKSAATPTTIEECVAEKQRIASEITAARSAKEEAETQKALAEASETSLTTQISLIDTQKSTLADAESSFDSTWLPLMTALGTNDFVTEVNAAVDKITAIETDVNAYIALNNAPAEASALPTALTNIRSAITSLRDAVEADLTTIESTFTNSLMSTYPTVTTELTTKASELENEKTEASQTVTTATQEVSTQSATITSLDSEWDSVESTCAPLME